MIKGGRFEGRLQDGSDGCIRACVDSVGIERVC